MSQNAAYFTYILNNGYVNKGLAVFKYRYVKIAYMSRV